LTISALEIDDRRWIDFVASQPAASSFHEPGWISVVAECYGFRPRALVLSEGSEIVAGVPTIELGRGRRRRWVSLPFTDRCGALLTDRADGARFAVALDRARRDEGLARIELRNSLVGGPGHPAPSGYWHEVELKPDEDAMRASFQQLRRRKLRRAEDKGVVSRASMERRDLCEVFFAMHVATRRRLGVPVQPHRMFELLWERVIEPGGGFVQIAYLGGVPIAGGVFLATRDRVTTKFSARDERYSASGGVDAMYWGAMRWGCEHGQRVFDFGRTENGNEGLRKFKRGWGAHEEALGYTVFSAQPPAVGHRRSEAALGKVIRASPTWVARAVGRVAYRYAA
jgi:CelD/BcsL family acetyltransferase involved in cellulose biosynthesis